MDAKSKFLRLFNLVPKTTVNEISTNSVIQQKDENGVAKKALYHVTLDLLSNKPVFQSKIKGKNIDYRKNDKYVNTGAISKEEYMKLDRIFGSSVKLTKQSSTRNTRLMKRSLKPVHIKLKRLDLDDLKNIKVFSINKSKFDYIIFFSF
jgi:hypothetical protein